MPSTSDRSVVSSAAESVIPSVPSASASSSAPHAAVSSSSETVTKTRDRRVLILRRNMLAIQAVESEKRFTHHSDTHLLGTNGGTVARQRRGTLRESDNPDAIAWYARNKMLDTDAKEAYNSLNEWNKRVPRIYGGKINVAWPCQFFNVVKTFAEEREPTKYSEELLAEGETTRSK